MIEKTKIVKMNLSVLGVYIRVARINAGISLRALASLTNISHTLISNIEMGKQTPSEETLREIMNALDLTLNTSDELSKKMDYYYKNIFTNLLNYKYVEAKKYVDELEAQEAVYTNSLELINYRIIVCLFYALSNSKAKNDAINRLEDVIDFLTLEQQQLIFFIIGVNHFRKFMFADAEKYLKKAIKVRSSDINVLINEFLVVTYLYQYKFTNSVSLCNSVIDEYENRNNYIRAMHCRILIARVYLKIMRFEKVLTIIDRVEQFAQQFNLQHLLDDCHVIKAGVYFYKNEYEKANKELDLVKDTSIDRYTYTRFRIYLVSKDEKLDSYYKTITSDDYKALTDSTKLLVKILMKWQNKEYRDDAYILEVDELKNLAVQGNDQELIGLTYNLLILYYKEDRKYKKALEISEELLEYKKIHIKFYSIKPTTI